MQSWVVNSHTVRLAASKPAVLSGVITSWRGWANSSRKFIAFDQLDYVVVSFVYQGGWGVISVAITSLDKVAEKAEKLVEVIKVRQEFQVEFIEIPAYPIVEPTKNSVKATKASQQVIGTLPNQITEAIAFDNETHD
ncbi:hypothetical protein CHS0354_001879 [Potamilus streckersoni]|uniref:Uncharacterized protein n=1 Tax=Potamilus streckersoni TaxID=2493646 RepID=A0AAE0TFC1_9BIVA|nr:hypothetical protein CHS0354_001879 [Potamilus streckersoni]